MIVVFDEVKGEYFLVFCPQSAGSRAVADMMWSHLQAAFAVEAFFRYKDSLVAAQCAFRTHFQIPLRTSVLERKIIVPWVANFGGGRTGSFFVQKRSGRHRCS